MKNKFRTLLLMTPSVFWLLGFFVLPMFVMVLFSFGDGSLRIDRIDFSLDTYEKFIHSAAFLRLLWRSTLIAFFTALLSVIFAYPIAYVLAFFAGEKRGLFLTLIVIPSWISFLLRVLAIKILLGSGGPFLMFMEYIGFQTETWPLLLYNRTAVIATLVYTWIPFCALPIFSALERIEKPVMEAASDLGASPMKSFVRVTLPLSLPGVVAAFFFVFIPTLGEWVTPSLMGGTTGIMYGNLIQDQFVRALNWPMGAVMSFVMMILVIVLLIILTRFIKLSELLEG